ncbi:MAG: TlpA family protein disulfide reductase [Candidatus Eremiobacteraeota bacterium]|nr:TlpA family protein disulfide reductase [Candidatus Eremiobacteraeota bacterium]
MKKSKNCSINMNKFIAFTVIFIIFAFFFACTTKKNQVSSDPWDGKVGPDFTFSDLSGNKVSLSSLKGKVVLLDFWSSCCPACLEKMSRLNELQEKYRSDGLIVLCINQGDREETVRKLVKKHSIKSLVLLDPEFEAGKKYRAFALPTMVLIDRDGIIRSWKAGFHPDFENQIREKIPELL